MPSSSSTTNHTPSLVDTIFQLSLTDLIKSLRSNSTTIPSALSSSLLELRSSDPLTVSVSLLKLSYLSSLHSLPLPPSSFFPSLSLLPSPSFTHKRIAYLFSSLFFHPSTTDLIPLLTHQLHKDLQLQHHCVVSLALNLLSSLHSPDIARHLAQDVSLLLSSASRGPSIKKKATAAALSIVTLSPDSVPVLFPKMVENLGDSVTVAAVVNVFCELTAVDARPYLPLAPDFCKVLVESRNNWVLIKVLKIIGRLGLVEKRLGRKVVEPICDLMRRTIAKSVAFECARMVFGSFREEEKAVRAAVEKVREEFLGSEDDANLRYLGLHALAMLGPENSWAVEESRDVVIKSLSDPDSNIRREALGLIMGMVFETNVVEISLLLIGYALRSDPVFANEILSAILGTCGQNYYEIVQDFDWYVSILGDMVRNPHCEKGEEIERQLVDIGLRVRDARLKLVSVARDLLIDPALLGNHCLDRILSAAAWVSGEYVKFSKNPMELLEALLQPRTNLLPPSVRAVYIQAVFKVFIFCICSYIEQMEATQIIEASEYSSVESEEDDVDSSRRLESKKLLTHESVMYVFNLVETAVGPLYECDEVEVHERARNVLGLIHVLKEIPDWKTEEGFRKYSKIHEIVGLVEGAFSEELGPVSVHAQQKVAIREELILKENLADLATILGEDDIIPSTSALFSLRKHRHRDMEEESEPPPVESTALLAEHRKRHGLYYLPTENDAPGSNDYPKANESSLSASNDDATDDLFKLTGKSLILRKANSTKPRPVVVKLDEGDSPSTSLKSVESTDDKLSGAIREVLLGNKEKGPASSLKTSSEKSSRRRSKDTVVNNELISESKENMGVTENASSSSKSRHHSHGKEKHRSHREKEDTEGKDHKNSSRGGHHHGKQKHKHRQRGDALVDVVPQAPVIQDFLL